MIVVGSKGFAKELLGVFHQLDKLTDLIFFDNINIINNDLLFNKFKIIHTIDEVNKHFAELDSNFVLGTGNPKFREELCYKFEKLGGQLCSVISPKSYIAPFDVNIGIGTAIITGAVIDNNVNIGRGSLINSNCTIGHDTRIGSFSEICPGVVISGNCSIGKSVFIGSNATILPEINIGEGAVIAAGSVVTRDIPDNCMVAGAPAIIKKEIAPNE